MEYKYMKLLQNTPKLLGNVNLPMSETQILELEKKFNGGKHFPLSLREFLFLAGKEDVAHLDIIDGYEATQNRAKEAFEYAKQEIKRPYFVVDTLHGDECITIIYLDEEEEDPKVYHCTPYAAMGGGEFIAGPGRTFSDYVNSRIHSLQKYGAI